MKRPPNYLFVLFAVVLFVLPSVVFSMLYLANGRLHIIQYRFVNAFASTTQPSFQYPTQPINQNPAQTVHRLSFSLTTGTRQFCLDYHLPICRGASNDPTHGDDTVIVDISTVCFRMFQMYWADVERDSRKDQLIVVLFLIITTGLLVYALIRPYVQSWLAVSYILVVY
jgi:hypothetical protein